FGPVLALLTHSPEAVLLRWLAALPDCTAVLQEARPVRTGAQRWRQCIAVAEPDRGELAAQAAPRELEILQRYLYADPQELTDRERPRSRGADGTVSVEQYASIEEEVEAAASWVGEQIEAGLNLEDIALIVPEPATYAPLLA